MIIYLYLVDKNYFKIQYISNYSNLIMQHYELFNKNQYEIYKWLKSLPLVKDVIDIITYFYIFD